MPPGDHCVCDPGIPVRPATVSGCPDLSGSVACTALSREELEALFLSYDLKRLEMYSRNMVDYHLIMDLIPAISRMYFLNQLGDLSLSAAQSVGYLRLVCWVSVGRLGCNFVCLIPCGSDRWVVFSPFDMWGPLDSEVGHVPGRTVSAWKSCGVNAPPSHPSTLP